MVLVPSDPPFDQRYLHLTLMLDLDAADHRIVAAVAAALRADGLAFVGIDVVDGHLAEVNVTSPDRPDVVCEDFVDG